MKTRRTFLKHSAAVTSGFFGLNQLLNAASPLSSEAGYGKLIRDPKGLLDLPEGFSYQILSQTGDVMNDGFKVPGQPDGMGVFDLSDGKVGIVRNHEIGHSGFSLGPFEDNQRLPDTISAEQAYDSGRLGAQPFVGGTTTIIYDLNSRQVVDQHLSLIGTDRNCAGGETPWGSWITCEEPADMTSPWGQYHGYCFEVPVTETHDLASPLPLRDMGRFRHEAIAVDPRSGVVYLTEDQIDGVIYRYLPKQRGKLAAGGRLQALKVRGTGSVDTRNWPTSGQRFPINQRTEVEWIDLEDITPAKDDLRLRAAASGAAVFSRAEGMWYGSASSVGEDSIYWACTDGGTKQTGQIFRYFPSPDEGTAAETSSPGSVELYLEPNDSTLLNNGDNITIAPSGHLFICEDAPARNRILGVTPGGDIYAFGQNVSNRSELAGACFSPDGSTLFVNIQTPGTTFAITGPFA